MTSQPRPVPDSGLTGSILETPELDRVVEKAALERDNVVREQMGSGQMFDSIAHRYDLLNRILSLGLDRHWRRRTVDSMRLAAGQKVLDLATGTGDLALEIVRSHPSVSVVGLDPSVKMLDRAGQKIEPGSAAREAIDLVVGDAQSLEFGDCSFDAACMAFGIRNVPDREKALSEVSRVLKPGAPFAILELSEPRRGLMSRLSRFYIHHLVPRLGALLSGAKEYRYLQKSIAGFPPAEEFADMMRKNGFDQVTLRPLTFGVVHLYVGSRAAAGPELVADPEAAR
jgi:demethylmenaquinone methyltransferase/2-methoxy-6-polyprenyl-1,4-benzoquinol methylase